MQNEKQNLTPEQYLDALPLDMRAAVLGLISSKFLMNVAVKSQPHRKAEFELLAFAIAKAIAGIDNTVYLDAMINHAQILHQLQEAQENATH